MAAVPPKTDPCWERLLMAEQCPNFTSLATKLTVGRLRRDVKEHQAAMPVAVHELSGFFASNVFAQRDLALI